MAAQYGEAGARATDMIVTGASQKCPFATKPPRRRHADCNNDNRSTHRETNGAVGRLQLRIDRLTFRV
jgi:hypothetical protein